MTDRNLVFLDTETTGLDPARHQIWEIAYAINDDPIQVSFVKHDYPTVDFTTREALRINGYLDRFDGVPYQAGDFETNLREQVLPDATIVAANPAFDTKMLYARWGQEPWHHRLIDIEAYAMGVLSWGRPRGLATIADYLGIEAPDHTAKQDVHVLRECYRALRAISDESRAAV